MEKQILTAVSMNDSTTFKDSIAAHNRGTSASVLQVYNPAQAKAYVGDARLHDSNFAFFTTTLANLHNELAEPKFFVTYLQDVPVKYGGGFVDYSTYYKVNWSGLLDEMRAVTANNSNYLPRVNAGLTQEKVDVYTYEVAYDLRFLELEKMKKLVLQKSIQDIYQNAIIAGWDLFVQKVAYLGINGAGGLFNSDKVLPITVDTGTLSGSDTTPQGFKALKDSEIVAVFNKIFLTYLQNTNMNINLLPDTFLVPTFVGADLSGRFNQLYTTTLRLFLAQHNLAVDESNGTVPTVKIQSRRELDTLGVQGKGRIVAYKNDDSFVRLDMPYPIQHFITLPNIEKMSYTTAFVGQVSAIQLPYNEQGEFGVVSYWDLNK